VELGAKTEPEGPGEGPTTPSEGERAAKALAIGAVLGLVLRLLARR
jgi:hypothetical protein